MSLWMSKMTITIDSNFKKLKSRDYKYCAVFINFLLGTAPLAFLSTNKIMRSLVPMFYKFSTFSHHFTLGPHLSKRAESTTDNNTVDINQQTGNKT